MLSAINKVVLFGLLELEHSVLVDGIHPGLDYEQRYPLPGFNSGVVTLDTGFNCYKVVKQISLYLLLIPLLDLYELVSIQIDSRSAVSSTAPFWAYIEHGKRGVSYVNAHKLRGFCRRRFLRRLSVQVLRASQRRFVRRGPRARLPDAPLRHQAAQQIHQQGEGARIHRVLTQHDQANQR